MRLVYGEDVFDEATADMNDEELTEAAENVRRGVPIATPVFDGAKEPDVNAHLKMAGWTSRVSPRSSTGARARPSRGR